ncbi:hypothetical protein D4764_05G0002430 [Takifugu flavidus]|uniref:Uncharacterized protein n=1 Tax=Takifugu flavidus TaxID=433684 RepID=A0A5C6MYT8_9TELE|nr:hypothetical protein D4764_05G0002430 [Takifugu flavidus]
MFIELRGASPIDRPVPIPVTLPSSPHSQNTTPPILPRPPYPPLASASRQEGAERLSKHLTHHTGVLSSLTVTPPPPPQPRVLVIVVIRRPLCERDRLH